MTPFIFLSAPYLIFLDTFIAITRYEMAHYDYWIDDYLKDHPLTKMQLETINIVATNNARLNAVIKQNRRNMIRIVK